MKLYGLYNLFSKRLNYNVLNWFFFCLRNSKVLTAFERILLVSQKYFFFSSFEKEKHNNNNNNNNNNKE